MDARRIIAGRPAALLMLALFAAGAASAADEEAAGPQQVIEKAANEVLDAINGRREELRKNPRELYAVVEEILLPHFDIDYASRLILARSWREASEEQRERFQEAMYDSLVRTYADGLLDFTADSLKVLPMRGKPDGDQVTVRTEVMLDDGTRAPVNYVMHKVDGDWKVFDVFIEGISYVLNYRKQLDAEIRRQGLGNVIERLEKDPDFIETAEPDEGAG